MHSVTALHDAGHTVYYAGASLASQFIRRTTPGLPLDATITEAADQLAARHTHPSPRLALTPNVPGK